MPASEIDEIFAKQSSGKPHNTATASSSSLPSTSLLKKKKKKKKELKTSVEEPTEPKSKKRPAPETIFDPSTNNPDPKRVKVTKAVPDKAVKKNPKNDAGRFTNSRGTGPRRTTEEGFSIYKEDELGIGDQGGDTLLCPFDCECCF